MKIFAFCLRPMNPNHVSAPSLPHGESPKGWLKTDVFSAQNDGDPQVVMLKNELEAMRCRLTRLEQVKPPPAVDQRLNKKSRAIYEDLSFAMTQAIRNGETAAEIGGRWLQFEVDHCGEPPRELSLAHLGGLEFCSGRAKYQQLWEAYRAVVEESARNGTTVISAALDDWIVYKAPTWKKHDGYRVFKYTYQPQRLVLKIRTNVVSPA